MLKRRRGHANAFGAVGVPRVLNCHATGDSEGLCRERRRYNRPVRLRSAGNRSVWLKIVKNQRRSVVDDVEGADRVTDRISEKIETGIRIDSSAAGDV